MKAFVFFFLTTLFVSSSGKSTNTFFCISDTSDGIGKKLLFSDVVFAGYTRAVHDTESEFLVFNVFKGDEEISKLFKNRKLSPLESALNRRLVNVSGFMDKFDCQQSIRVGETYLLFAKFREKLILYDSDAIQPYSKNKEEEIQKYLAPKDGNNVEQWSAWSSCSKSCGGGVQTRVKSCGQKNCLSTESSTHQRSCNTYPCIGLLDVLDVVGLRKTRLHPADRPTAYRLINKGSWSADEISPPSGFPTEFSLMTAIRATSSPTSGFLFRMLKKDRDMQLALHFSDETVSLVLPNMSFVRFKQEKKLKQGEWYWVSFSVRRNTVTLFLNCKPAGVLKVPNVGDVSPFGTDELAKYVVGSLSTKDRSVFQGDVEQLLFSEAPSAAAEQCSVVEQPLATSSERTLPVEKRKETTERFKIVNKKNQTFAPKREDEDFDFSEDGSGTFYDEYDDVQEDKPPPDIRKAVLLLSESPTKGDEEEEEESDDNDFLYDEEPENEQKPLYDDDDDDNDSDDFDDEDNGSGSRISTFEWSNWSECSQTCNWGVRKRALVCDGDVRNQSNCSKEEQTESCFLTSCPTTTTTKLPTTEKIRTTQKYTKIRTTEKYTKIRTTEKYTKIRTTEKPHMRPQTVSKENFPFNTRHAFMKTNRLHPMRVAPMNDGHHQLPKLNFKASPYSVLCKPGCRNGGYCNAGKCVCKKGYSGKFCENAACDGLCQNGAICAKHGRCICLPGFYGFRCEFRKCTLSAVKKPYQKSFKKKIIKEEKFPCGAWGWKKCSRTKVHYVPEFRTFYRTEYVCHNENEVIYNY